MAELSVADKRTIERMFDDAAVTYNRTGPAVFTEFGARLVEHLPLTPGARVLDVATGTGAALLPAARRVGPDGQVVGVDLSAEILKEAGNVAKREGLTNVELLKMDAERLDFDDQAFDAVICALGVFLFPDMEAALSEMYRVCRAGGHICVSVFGPEPLPFGPAMPIFFQQAYEYREGVQMPQSLVFMPEDMEARLKKSGFRAAESVTETFEFVYESMEDWWSFLLTVGPRPTILGMDEEKRVRFKQEYTEKLRPFFAEDGLHVSVSVVYTMAQR